MIESSIRLAVGRADLVTTEIIASPVVVLLAVYRDLPAIDTEFVPVPGCHIIRLIPSLRRFQRPRVTCDPANVPVEYCIYIKNS